MPRSIALALCFVLVIYHRNLLFLTCGESGVFCRFRARRNPCAKGGCDLIRMLG
jgi:hypothetical protein